MQKPFTIAVVGKGRLCSSWNTSQPSLTKDIASCGVLKRVNSSTSAPATKLSFAERRGGGDFPEAGGELFQRLARKSVGRFALLVEGQPGEAVAVGLAAPVLD